MAYALTIIGGIMAITPGFLDPYNWTFNGLTLLGMVFMFSGLLLAVRSR